MKFTAALAFLIALVATALAQPVVVNGNAGFNADSPYNKLYNTNTVINFKGKVTGMVVAAPMKDMANAVSLVVKAANGKTFQVDVGPEWYVNNQHVRLKVKDDIQVTGSRVSIDGHDVILAEQIVKGKAVLALRRPAGRPYWDAVWAQAPAVTDDGINHKALNGQIIKIDTFIDGTNGETQVLTIHTDQGDYQVALAPTWFMQRQALQTYLGQTIDVNSWAPVGVPTQPAGRGLVAPPIVFATSIAFGQQWMILRSPNGVPIWYGPGN